jgi:hypothetical protein
MTAEGRNNTREQLRRVLLAVLVAAVSCVSTTLKGSKVRITTNPDVVRGCKYIGQVRGSERMWGGMAGQGAAQDNAVNRLKNKTAEMGGTVVFLNSATTNTSGSTQIGEAYRCAE